MDNKQVIAVGVRVLAIALLVRSAAEFTRPLDKLPYCNGPQQGRKVFTLKTEPARIDSERPSDRVVKQAGFSLHAGVCAEAHQRDKLERLCRYDVQGCTSIAVGRKPRATHPSCGERATHRVYPQRQHSP